MVRFDRPTPSDRDVPPEPFNALIAYLAGREEVRAMDVVHDMEGQGWNFTVPAVARTLREMGWTARRAYGDRLVYRRPETRHLAAEGRIATAMRAWSKSHPCAFAIACAAVPAASLGFFLGQLVRCLL